MPARSVAIGLILTLTLALRAVQAAEVTLAYQGLRLNANLETTGPDWRQGTLILMTHGTLAHGAMEIMHSLQQAFKDRGISSLSLTLSLGIDNRHGSYDCAIPHRHRHNDADAEIGAWLDWLKSQGVSQVALLGHSRGGNQAARYAVAHPQTPLSAVILIAPSTWSEAEAAAEYQRRFAKDLATQLDRARQLEQEGGASKMLAPIDFLYCADTQATPAAFLSYYSPDPDMDTPRLIPQIKAPLLVVVGSKDEVVRGLGERIEPVVDGQRVTLLTLEGADHFFRDLYVEDIADAVQHLIAPES